MAQPTMRVGNRSSRRPLTSPAGIGITGGNTSDGSAGNADFGGPGGPSPNPLQYNNQGQPNFDNHGQPFITPPVPPVLVLHLDAALGVTMAGSTVTRWADQSGFGNDALQNLTDPLSTVPVNFNPADVNGLPSIVFQTNTYGSDPAYLNPTGPYSSLLLSMILNPPFTMVLLQSDTPGPGSGLPIWTSLYGNMLSFKSTANPHGIAFAPWQANDSALAGLKMAPTNLSAINSTFGITSQPVNLFIVRYFGPGNIKYTGYSIAGRGDFHDTAAGSPLSVLGTGLVPGEIGQGTWISIPELMAYTGCISDADVTALVLYFATKYAI